MKRCAKFALVVKKHWLDKILAGEKDWESRGCSTTRRGWIHLAESKAGGRLAGRARLVDCVELNNQRLSNMFIVMGCLACPWSHISVSSRGSLKMQNASRRHSPTITDKAL